MTTATSSDEGKALKAKTVSGGKVTEWEFGNSGLIDAEKQLIIDILKKIITTDNEDDNIDSLNDLFFPPSVVDMTDYRTNSAPNETTYDFNRSYTSSLKFIWVAECPTVTGGTLSVSFDKTICKGFDIKIYLLDNGTTPYQHAGYSAHNASGIEGDWTWDGWQTPGNLSSFGVCAGPFTTEIPDGKSVIIAARLGSATGDSSVIANQNAFAAWAYDGGITAQIIGGTEVENNA